MRLARSAQCILAIAATAFVVLCPGLVRAQGERNPLRGPSARIVVESTETGTVRPANVPPMPEPLLTPKSLEARAALVEGDNSLPDDIRRKLASTYREGATLAREAEQSRNKAARYLKEIKLLPQQLQEVRAELAAMASKPAQQPVPKGRVELDEALTQTTRAREAAQAEWDKLMAEIAERETRRQEVISTLRPAARDRVAAVERQLREPFPIESPQASEARRALLIARKQAAEAELEACNREIEHSGPYEELLGALRDLTALDRSRAESRLGQLQQAASQARQAVAETEVRATRETLKDVSGSYPPVEAVARQNVDLAALGSGPQGITAKIDAACRELEVVEKQLRDVERRAHSLAEKTRLAGLDNVMGALLRKEQESLPHLERLRREIAIREREIGGVELERLKLDETRASLSDLDARIETELATLPANTPAEQRADAVNQLRGLLTKQRDLVDELLTAHKTCEAKLVELNVAEQELLVAAEKYGGFIAERILWIRSANPLSLADAGRSWDTALWLVSVSNWLDVVHVLNDDLVVAPLIYAAALLAFVGMLIWHGRLRAQLYSLGEQVEGKPALSVAPSLWAAGMTALVALLWPSLAWFVAWRLRESAEHGEFVQALGGGLGHTAVIYLTAELFRQVCREKGLAEAHFQWDRDALTRARYSLEALMLFGLPAVLIVTVTQWQLSDVRRDSLGRIAFIAGMFFLAIFARRMFRPGTGVLFEMLGRTRQPAWFERLRYAWYPLAAGVPLALALIAGLGYFYTAIALAMRLLDSVWLTLGLTVAHALAYRWLVVMRRQMSLEQARQKRNADGTAPEKTVDVSQVGAQAQQLLRTCGFLGLLFGMWAVWVDVLPALGIFRSIVIWSDGEQTITVANLGLACFLVLLTMAAGRNIPGLLELALFKRLPIDAGGRYTVMAVARYVIGFTGFSSAANAMGIGWTQVQWLVAAMTVGLGFGLQEIFANFVSGVIILFERPIRVGDTVTVGGISGTVTRIRIRATTIVDWDRKELIVPNKEFVTGQVVNWTLSDPVLRLKIPVGIAYGSDIAQARQLLLLVAEANPNVLSDPAPKALFRAFGESSLDFELRAYVPHVDLVPRVQDELLTAIDEAFRQADIEVPFPQRDIHVRSLPRKLAELEGREEVAEDDDDDEFEGLRLSVA